MISKHMTAALIGSALLATAAMAQTPSATTNSTAPAATTSAAESGFHGDWRSSKLIGLNVYNDSNEKLGSISELLLNKDGKIQAAVIGVGGFLGVGQHDVAVAFDKLKFVDTPVPSTSASTSTKTGPAGTGMHPGTTTGAAPAATTTSSKTNPWYPDHAMFSATKDQLKSMAEFKYTE